MGGLYGGTAKKNMKRLSIADVLVFFHEGVGFGGGKAQTKKRI